MAQGFIMLFREGGLELLQNDPKAFLLFSQIALRASRKDVIYSMTPLKANQALIGDHKKIGLSIGEYRNAKKRLKKQGLATFLTTNKGTIATLISTTVYDINAEEASSLQPSISSLIDRTQEPSNYQQNPIEELSKNHPDDIEELLTIRKEDKKKTTQREEAVVLYQCLEKCPSLSLEDKRSLMQYQEERVIQALEWASKATIKTSLIQTLHWHCREVIPPSMPPSTYGKNDMEREILEYNQLLQENGFQILVKKNEQAIVQNCLYIFSHGRETTITLKNPLEMIRSDLAASKKEILSLKRSVS